MLHEKLYLSLYLNKIIWNVDAKYNSLMQFYVSQYINQLIFNCFKIIILPTITRQDTIIINNVVLTVSQHSCFSLINVVLHIILIANIFHLLLAELSHTEFFFSFLLTLQSQNENVDTMYKQGVRAKSSFQNHMQVSAAHGLELTRSRIM